MPDYYHAPALILTALLLPAFGYLYLRFRDTRTLLWFLGFLGSLVSMVLLFTVEPRGFSGALHPWLGAAGQTVLLVTTALFLASLSPLHFRLGRFHILYVFPFILPLVIYSVLLYGVFRGDTPHGPINLIFPVLAALALGVGLFWGAARGSMPPWLGLSLCAALGALGFWAWYAQGPAWAMAVVISANQLMTALLLISVFRRFSPGVMLSVLGFVAWSLAPAHVLLQSVNNTALDLAVIRIIVMSRVVAAMGMIVLALEDELRFNQAAREREHRARREMEAYTKLILSRRRVEDFDLQGDEICETVTAHSRFAQAALLLTVGGRFRLMGASGLDAATVKALGELAARLPGGGFLTPGSAPPAVENSLTLRVELTPWMLPGDDLQRLRFTEVLAVPMNGRSGVEGALLLAGMRTVRSQVPGNPMEGLRSEDLLPLEMLAARLQATRSQTMMLEKLVDSEKFAGLGQLAGNVTQQLNNPLTVILGYGSLLEGAPALEPQDRKAVDAILAEARRMRSTLESLSRIARPSGDQRTAVSIAELLGDLEQLYRSEFLQRSIEFHLSIAAELPRVLCSARQVRQALLNCLQYAMAAVGQQGAESEAGELKTIRLEATSEGNVVQVLVAHTGAGFLHPERAFDPFTPAQPGGETSGLGLSLCATILRDNGGRASAVNLEPRGAAIILELQAA